MKKGLLLFLTVFLLTLSSVASAETNHHDWSNPSYHRSGWHEAGSHHSQPGPFTWHQRYDRNSAAHYRMARIYDRHWNDRFPGLHSYRWHDRGGFWYHGRRITDAVFFYDGANRLVSIGFMHNGSFIFLRDDSRGFESHESFFLSWWR